MVKTKAQTDISGIINTYYKVTAIAPGTINGNSYSGITLQSITGLAKGDKILIIQMKGAVIDETNSASFGNINNIGNAGKYEFSSICGFLNNTIVLSNQLLNTYDAALVQIVRVPVYDDARVTATLLAQDWSPATGLGGVLAFEVNGTLALNANVSADSAGFRGGAMVQMNGNCNAFGLSPVTNYHLAFSTTTVSGAKKGEGISEYISGKEYARGKQANGGGGGNALNAGGAGGGNYAAGGLGGIKNGSGCNTSNPGGEAGLALNTFGYSLANNRIFLGGGGGAGHDNNLASTSGGHGGGIVIITCNTLEANGYTISANGSQGIFTSRTDPPFVPNEANGDGAGGGGAGGLVILNTTNYTGNLFVNARGANGDNAGFLAQCVGPGGGGGGGFIWSKNVLPVTVTTNVSGGAPGIIKNSSSNPPCELTPNGATAGSTGNVQSGFVAPQGSTPFNCAVLSIESLKEWQGRKINNGIELIWKLEQTDVLDEVWLEKKTIRGPFKTIKVHEQPAEGYYSYTDESNDLPATYRLMVLHKTGRKEYSDEIFFEREKVKRLLVYPNPVKDELRIELPVASFGRTAITVFDYTGKLVASKEITLSANQPFVIVSVNHLPAGTYTVRCYWRDELYIARIVKQQ